MLNPLSTDGAQPGRFVKETEQQNLPGTTGEYRRKMKYTVEELRGGAAKPFTNMFHEWLKRTGRLNPGPR